MEPCPRGPCGDTQGHVHAFPLQCAVMCLLTCLSFPRFSRWPPFIFFPIRPPSCLSAQGLLHPRDFLSPCWSLYFLFSVPNHLCVHCSLPQINNFLRVNLESRTFLSSPHVHIRYSINICWLIEIIHLDMNTRFFLIFF